MYKAFRAEFANKQLKILSSPRMQYLASTEVAVNLQPELYVEVDGTLMMWKFGLSKDSRPEHIIRMTIQILSRASKHKGFEIPIERIRFLDTVTGRIYEEQTPDYVLDKKLQSSVRALAETWNKVA